jgi:uncharacterized protein DUF6624
MVRSSAFLSVAVCLLSVPASAQHPATVFMGSPSPPGMSAPVVFPVGPDPGGIAPSSPSTPQDLHSDLSNRQRQIERRTTELGLDRLASEPGLMRQLLAMMDDDRRVRRSLPGRVTTDGDATDAEIDRRNLVLLKAIVAEHGWPTIPMVGAAASQAASAILVHAADHGWQEQLVPELQRLVETGKIFGPDVAEIVDRLLVRSGKRQKFGTQIEIRNGEVVILPVQDSRGLDEWRAEYLLSAISAWRRSLESVYQMPVKGPAENRSTR